MAETHAHSAGSGTGTGTGLVVATGDCWNRIGTSGDRSCPELKLQTHCRNCPVFASAARTFFDRPAPEGYLAEWTQWLSGGIADLTVEQVVHGDDRELISVLIFRLGHEWLAFRTQVVAEVTLPRPVHRIPHRSNTTLIGLVNLRGQLQLCVSLHALLGVNAPPEPAAEPPPVRHGDRSELGKDRKTELGLSPGTRLVVLRDRDRSELWIFGADEVLGVHRLPRVRVRNVSSSLANPEVSFSQAILSWEDHSVGFLDEQRVFAALRSIGQ